MYETLENPEGHTVGKHALTVVALGLEQIVVADEVEGETAAVVHQVPEQPNGKAEEPGLFLVQLLVF